MGKIYRQAVMAVIVNDRNRILIGYSPRDKSYKFPQGGLLPGEDIVTGIKRELIEELDYHLDDSFIRCICSEKVRYPFPPDVHPVFMGQELGIVKIQYDPAQHTIPQDDEFDKLYWIQPEELKNFQTEYRAEAYQEALRICKLI